jgi:hypothetical protein
LPNESSVAEPAGIHPAFPADAGFPPEERLLALLGWAPVQRERIGGGRNSQVFRLAAADGRQAALKRYFRHPGDARDRLGTEQAALAFCRRHGLPVPGPLAADPAAGFALCEFIDGAPVPDPSLGEVDQAVAFLLALRARTGDPQAAALPVASEACFSFPALEANIHARLAPLVQAGEGHPGLRAFLDQELLPAWESLRAETPAACRRAGLAHAADLPAPSRTLSPSDFGFHNALRRDGALVFLDFEYFGWDDPAKTLCDLLLHPGMALPTGHRVRLAHGLLAGMADLPELPARTRVAFPLYGIKWCLILLNEFLRGPLERRTFANPVESPAAAQARQLHKAQGKLRQLLDDHAHFPYFPA